MKQRASARFAIQSWDETPYGEVPGLRGEGASAVGHAMEHPLTLDYGPG